MRLHLENVSQKVEDLEKAKAILEKEFQEETVEIKREKRRLNDLLTLREEEIAKYKESEKGRVKGLQERDVIIGDYERKLKHMEKKYEKNLGKLNYEIQRLKKGEVGECEGSNKAMFGKVKEKGALE